MDNFFEGFILASLPLDLRLEKCLCAIAKIMELAVGYYRDMEYYVRLAVTLENPELSEILGWAPGETPAPRTKEKNIHRLQAFAVKVMQSGLQPMDYLTRGLAGALLPAGTIKAKLCFHPRYK